MASTIATAYLQIMPSMKGMSGAITRELGTAGKQGGSMLGSGLASGFNGVVSGALMGAGMAAFNKITASIAGNLDAAVSRSDTLRNFPKIMSNLGISGEAAARALKETGDHIKGLPTGLDEAAAGIKRFTSINGDISKSAKIFQSVNDALLAGGADAEAQGYAMRELTNAYATGKLTLQQWNVIEKAMPAQVEQIGKKWGLTGVQLHEALQTGQLSMEDLMNEIIRLDTEGGDGFAAFGVAAKDATKGVESSMTNMNTAIARGIANIINVFVDEGGTSLFVDFGTTVEGALTRISTALKSWLDNGGRDQLVAIGETVKAVLNGIKDAVKWVVNTPLAMSALKNLGIGLAAFFVSLKVYQTGATIVTGVKGVFTALGGVGKSASSAASSLSSFGKGVNFKTISTALGAFALVIVSVGALCLIAKQFPQLIEGGAILGAMALNVMPALIIFSIATAGLGALGLIPIPLILSGLAGLALAIGGIAALIAAAGALQQIPGLQWLMSEGGKFLGSIAGILGDVVGKFVNGVISEASKALPEVARNLSQSFDILAPSLAAIPAGAGQNLSLLGEGIAAFSAAGAIGILSAMANQLSGDALIKFFKEGIIAISEGLRDSALNFASAAATIPADAGEKFGALGVGLAKFGAGEISTAIGNVMAFFSGGTDFQKMGQGLDNATASIGQFTDKLGLMEPRVSSATQTLVNFGSTTEVALWNIATAGANAFFAFGNAVGSAMSDFGTMIGGWMSWTMSTMSLNLFQTGWNSAESWAQGFRANLSSQNFSKSLNLNVNVDTKGANTFTPATIQAIRQDIARAVAGGAI